MAVRAATEAGDDGVLLVSAPQRNAVLEQDEFRAARFSVGIALQQHRATVHESAVMLEAVEKIDA